MEIVKKHPLWLRISHWLNVPAFCLMVWSGILIYWANDAYAPFFPQWFYEAFDIPQRLAEGMAIHFTVAWVLVL
ncbi:MAG: thiosulfate reductase, partial [Proteobacteria bacterium]